MRVLNRLVISPRVRRATRLTTDLSDIPSDADDPIVRGSLREQVSDRILTAVFEKRFASDERLVVQRLADLYGVSLTPVRESLVELAGLGIVELLPNRGAVVRPFGSDQLREMSQVRRVLESEAARCACGRIPPEPLEEIHAELLRLKGLPHDATWDRDARAADTRLHGLISDYCGNARLAADVRRYLVLFRSLRDVAHVRDAWTNYRRSNDTPEHLDIVSALIARDADQAGLAMDQHIRSITDSLTQVMFGQP